MIIPAFPAPDSNTSARRIAPLRRQSVRARRRFLLVALLTLALALPSLHAGTTDTADAPRVIATYYPLYLIAASVMDGLSPAPSLLLEPAGGCAHGLSLRPSQVATLGRADLIVETGLGLEPFLESDRFPWRDGVARVPLARDIPEADLIPLLEEHDHGHADHAHGAPETEARGHEEHAPHERGHDERGHDDHGHDDHGQSGEGGQSGHDEHDDHDHDAAPHDVGNREGFNGHAWSSPRLAAQMTRTLAEALAAHDPDHASLYRSNASTYAGRLDALADELAAVAEPLRGARVAISHTSLAYLARDLGLDVVVTLRDEDENEPGPRGLTRLIDAARAGGLDAVLYDPQDEGRLARLFARETGCGRVLRLDPVASGPLDNGAYARIMEANLETIRAWAASLKDSNS